VLELYPPRATPLSDLALQDADHDGKPLQIIDIRVEISIDGVPLDCYTISSNMAGAQSKRGRKRHVQQPLFRHGGKRKGAGRKPPIGGRAGASHNKRPEVEAKQALHVVLRVVAAVGGMRRRAIYKAIRAASITAAKRGRFRIVHISIQQTHVHLLVEAENKLALARGMLGFQISAARNINTVLSEDKFRRRRGRVFVDRYHLVVISSPTQARHALSYILNNWRKHREDRGDLTRRWKLDWFSSAAMFPGWREHRDDPALCEVHKDYEPLVVVPPRSWLLREGWALAGAISTREMPSKRRS
jgi:REP element-mobilizing transposase RayT